MRDVNNSVRAGRQNMWVFICGCLWQREREIEDLKSSKQASYVSLCDMVRSHMFGIVCVDDEEEFLCD